MIPEVPDNSLKLRQLILRGIKDELKTYIEFYIPWGSCLYSYKSVEEIPEFKCEVEGTGYTVKIQWVQVMTATTDRDYQTFLKIFFNSMMKTLKFEQIGRK